MSSSKRRKHPGLEVKMEEEEASSCGNDGLVHVKQEIASPDSDGIPAVAAAYLEDVHVEAAAEVKEEELELESVWYPPSVGAADDDGDAAEADAGDAAEADAGEEDHTVDAGEQFMAFPGDLGNEAKNILTIIASDPKDNSRIHLSNLELAANVMDKVRMRGRVLAYFVDAHGWLWVHMATEKQADKIVSRISNRLTWNDQAFLTVQQTRMCDWPPGIAPQGERTVPELHFSRHRAGVKGGMRHRSSSSWTDASSSWEPGWNQASWKWSGLSCSSGSTSWSGTPVELPPPPPLPKSSPSRLTAPWRTPQPPAVPPPRRTPQPPAYPPPRAHSWR